jgi:transposase
MRFVAVKSLDQQAMLMLHKVRDLLVRQRTMLINALRGHLAEFGVVTARGPAGVKAAIVELHGMQDSLPPLARMAFHQLVDRLEAIGVEIRKAEREIVAWCRHDDASRRLATIPGIGPITASAIAAAVPDASVFRSGRQFAAWLGLTPRAHSSGGKQRLGGISKQGDGYIRRLLVTGATAVIRMARQSNASKVWAARLLQRKPARLVSVALANKTARIAWAVLARNQSYMAPAV